jgi:hypothetical protein
VFSDATLVPLVVDVEGVRNSLHLPTRQEAFLKARGFWLRPCTLEYLPSNTPSEPLIVPI